ncbi:MAG: TonB-dependent receptor plug domain-containing protein [Leptospiraceae bacterium]|nr:TonB-dependent receptor plug domain-containing protein [Leptospiraceae bacterium]
MNSLKINLNHKLLLTILFFLFIGELSATAFRARIFSRKKSAGEANVRVLIFETKKAYVTDAEGYFDAEVPEAGQYTFRILRDSGIQELKKSVSQEGEVITLFTDEVAKPKGGIDIEGQKDKTILSRYKVRYDEIKRMPGTLGEALNGLQTLPGIFAPPFFGGGNTSCLGGLVIRGSGCNTNTYLYDDLPIFYAFHFDSINSVIHNDLIKTIDVYTGAYPANFANATGGVIEIESTETTKKRQSSATLSLLLGQAMYQTPIFNGKGYFAAGGKVGWLDKTIGSLGLIPEGIRLPQYNSSNVKFVYNFTPQHQISFTSLTANDNFVANFSSKPINDPTQDVLSTVAGARVAAGQAFRTLGLRYTWTPGTNFNNRLTLINYEPIVKTNVKFGSIEADFLAKAPYTGLRQDLSWTVAKFLKVEAGTEYRVFSYSVSGFGVQQRDPNNFSPNPYNTTNPDFEKRDITQKTQSNYANAYSTLKFSFGNLRIEPGARYDFVGYSNKGAFGPRGLVSYKFEGIRKGLTIFGGAGDYFRYPFFDQAISRESGNPNIDFEKARKYGGGVELQATDEWSFKTEVFKQEFRNLIVDDPFISEAFGLNPDKAQWVTKPVVTNRSLNYSNKGSGWAHGYELFIKKSNRPGTKDWFGWISYTWSQSFRNRNQYSPDYDLSKAPLSGEEARIRSLFPNTREIIFENDITHLLSVVYGWRINEDYQIGGRWIYRTAFPYTPVVGDDGGQFRNPTNNQTYWNPTYSNNPYNNDYINSRRQAPYARFDIRFDKFLNYEWGYMNLYVEVINIFMRENKQGENFDSSRPYSRTNPVPQDDFYLLRPPGSGFKSPFFNIGMEVRF